MMSKVPKFHTYIINIKVLSDTKNIVFLTLPRLAVRVYAIELSAIQPLLRERGRELPGWNTVSGSDFLCRHDDIVIVK